jgi:glycosyltransferase involved in cell wall biosynthesis
VRILLVTGRYYPHRGGLETVVHNLAREFNRTGHDVMIVTNRYPRTLPAAEVIDGIQVQRMQFLYPQMRFLREKRLDLLMASLWFVIFTSWTLLLAIRQFKPDVINLHYVGAPGFFLSMLHSFWRFPWVVSLHGGDVDGEPRLSRQGKRLFERVTRRADVITACSRDLARQAEALSPAVEKKLRVIHNGVDARRFATAPRYRHDQPYVAAVGQLASHKGFDLLVDAFANVAGAHGGVDLIIAGDGECRKELIAQVQERKLSERVHFLGRVDEPTVASIMAGSLFVAVPSKREPFGIVALEAMAAGRPVLATPVGGIPEFLPNGVNRQVKPDRESWTAALSDLLDKSQGGRLEGEANKAVAERFNWREVAGRYLDAYAAAMAAQATNVKH